MLNFRAVNCKCVLCFFSFKKNFGCSSAKIFGPRKMVEKGDDPLLPFGAFARPIFKDFALSLGYMAEHSTALPYNQRKFYQFFESNQPASHFLGVANDMISRPKKNRQEYPGFFWRMLRHFIFSPNGSTKNRPV